eukprot:4430887-Amphidinium_carterae.1
MERERPGNAGPSLSYHRFTDCGVPLANKTSRTGVNGAEVGAKFQSARARWTKPSTSPIRLRLGMPAGNTKLVSFWIAPSVMSEFLSRN